MTAAASGGADEVIRRVEGPVGWLTLNRPKAINALTHTMVLAMTEALDDWAADDSITCVVVDGAGERGLCAGGDVRAFYHDARSGGTGSVDFWADEYRLNSFIARYPKPYVALMDGLVMGGGVGISAHGSVRVVTERSRIAMPETGIGFVPDVGGTWLLSRMPGQTGTHAALTAGTLSAADAITAGLADQLVPTEQLPELVDRLVAGTAPADAVALLAVPAGEGRLAAARGWIDSCYAAGTVEEILQRLRAHGDPSAAVAADEIAAKSPTALTVTLAALRRAVGLADLDTALVQEFRVSVACLRHHDLAEGIRAQIIDKDRFPRWSPSALADVDDALVAEFFAAPSGGDLDLDRRLVRAGRTVAR
ncbi:MULTISPECIES: enoyl-CoA hydratase/isomerase family protein [unclassified Pseudofrankia]|uniref:enoyl-CoA hydratase/isomerase family protein n=1 Tax=unclassified Pseudofrankia TaxID=2994372 RepID=UPI0008D8E2DE|nr:MULTISPECIES: enoyl-CoA hydratase/isomerase family protein [unclassified Pseudofrankia]MDT3440134.1 enoyl-CoA hydratase/isomerase family protein [Pseudofrankia sp. BMG5.37]OHV59570.1 3-hydroxyisobutyryl-CoA hydrolase [Pseudofrankia sp. BMG5.36]